MRTNKLTKALFTALLVSTLFVSCGSKKNKSGSSSTPPPGTVIGTTDPWGGGINASGNQNKLPANWRDTIFNDYRCYTGMNSTKRVRITPQAPGSIRINAGSLHVGVTVKGDVLILSNANNKVVIELYVCEREGLQNTAQFTYEPELNKSYECPLGQISAASIEINKQTGREYLGFHPLNFSAPSSLCQQSSFRR